MASAEQPQKKRRLYKQFQHPSRSALPPPPLRLHSPEPPPPGTPPVKPLTPQEILRRQKSREEIREVYSCVKKIKCCIAQEEAERRRPVELEQAYLYLITASRGCASVQRIVADLIPRYASYCPTALEAAIKVVINMHNCSLAVLNKGEDFDGVAYETAEACISGLVKICQAATKEAPTSSVNQGICSAVFRSVFTFLISSFEGKDIFQIIDKGILKIQDNEEFVSKFKEKFVYRGDSTMLKLSKFRAVSFLRLLLCCPKYSLSVCFELFGLTATDAIHKDGHYFLRQLTNRIDDVVSYPLTHENGEMSSIKSEGNIVGNRGRGSKNNALEHVSPAVGNSILGQILDKDLSLKSWFFSKYRQFPKSAFLETVSAVLDSLFESLKEVDGYGSECGQSKYINKYPVPGESSNRETSSEVVGRESSSRMFNKSCPDNMVHRLSSSHLRKGSSVENHSSASPSIVSGGAKSMDFDFVGGVDSSQSRSSMPRDLSNRSILSPTTRPPVGSRGSGQGFQREKIQVSSMDLSSPTLRSTSEGGNNSFSSPRHQATSADPSLNQVTGSSEDDHEAMDVFAASKQLWVGSLGPDATEWFVRSQFEKFGPINQLTYSPIKGFAVIEYRNIMDAIKARARMQGSLVRGACLSVKFSNMGSRSRRDKDGNSVPSSCHVYVGYISNQWQRDEILNEVSKVLHKGPQMATHLNTEGALLMEFDTPDEANIVIVHLRKFRRESINSRLRSNGAFDVVMHGGSGSANSRTESTQTHTRPENLPDGYSLRISQLSSMVSQLRMKYNIAPNVSIFNGHCGAGPHHNAGRRDEQSPMNTLWISVPQMNTIFVTDGELFNLCNVAISNVGSVVRLTKNIATGCSWFVECNSVETAKTLLKHFRDCPGMFFQVEFSHTMKNPSTPLVKPDGNLQELTSPRLNPENQGILRQSGHAIQPNWAHHSHRGMGEVGSRTQEALFADPSRGGIQSTSGSADQMWMFRKPEMEMHSGPGNAPCRPAPTIGPPPIVPQIPVQQPQVPVQPPQIPQPSQIRPHNFHPSGSWDARSINNHLLTNPVSTSMMPNIHHNPMQPPYPPPFMQASVTPVTQFPGNSMHPFGHMFSAPMVTPPVPPYMMPPLLPTPLPNMQLPLPAPQRPPPYAQLPIAPPLPGSPPPFHAPVPSDSTSSEYLGHSSMQYKWHGPLSKSGVQFCTVFAQRAESDICKYSDDMAEPTEWPAGLDMTKRTDFRHVNAIFSNTPPHKRDVCWLLPISEEDHKGFQDFVTYLQQRDCAGVIKIPAVTSLWPRLLFILPYSLDMCSQLSIAPNPSLCLIGLVLPKETNFDWI